MNHFKGLIAAHFTPLHPDGSLNLSIVGEYVEKLIADGLTGIFVCGSNGEGPNLTIEERMQVAEAFKKAAGNRLKIFVHVGHTSIAESRKLAVHAGQIGADAISSVAAFYFKLTSVANLVDCMAQIASAAPQLPFYYYHIPHLTGIGMDMKAFLRLGGEKIPNLAGIKYTAPTLHEYQACLNYANGKYDILYGTDEMLLPAMSVGAEGAIGSTYNFAAPLYLQVMEAFKSGNVAEAQRIQYFLVQAVQILLQYPPIPAQKAIMKMGGLNLGPSRLPLENLTSGQYLNLQRALEEIHFFEKVDTYKATQ